MSWVKYYIPGANSTGVSYNAGAVKHKAAKNSPMGLLKIFFHTL
jgi:hypothetical protein